jgi:hypothetical protein
VEAATPSLRRAPRGLVIHRKPPASIGGYGNAWATLLGSSVTPCSSSSPARARSAIACWPEAVGWPRSWALRRPTGYIQLLVVHNS